MKAAGWLLVVLQFALICVLAWPMTAPKWSIAGTVLTVLAIVLSIWTVRHNQIGNFNIHPTPKASGQLVTTGPYQYVRHPMYVALLILGGAACFFYRDSRKIAFWFMLAAVLYIKSHFEERALVQRFSSYDAYRQRVRRFIPGVF